MELDAAAMFLSHRAASRCGGPVHSGALRPTQTAGSVQWTPSEAAEHGGHCPGAAGAVVVLQHQCRLLCGFVWHRVYTAGGGAQTERGCGVSCLCRIYFLMVC